jgi:hypothetical protein
MASGPLRASPPKTGPTQAEGGANDEQNDHTAAMAAVPAMLSIQQTGSESVAIKVPTDQGQYSGVSKEARQL